MGSVETVRSPKRCIRRSPSQDWGLSVKTILFLASFLLGSFHTSCLRKDPIGCKKEKMTQKMRLLRAHVRRQI